MFSILFCVFSRNVRFLEEKADSWNIYRTQFLTPMIVVQKFRCNGPKIFTFSDLKTIWEMTFLGFLPMEWSLAGGPRRPSPRTRARGASLGMTPVDFVTGPLRKWAGWVVCCMVQCSRLQFWKPGVRGYFLWCLDLEPETKERSGGPVSVGWGGYLS